MCVCVCVLLLLLLFLFVFLGDRDSSMYQRECEALRHQFSQKDAFIEKLQTEKASMQVQTGYVCMQGFIQR